MTTQLLTLYGIPNCDTIKKTRQWLADQQIPYTFHDYKKQGIDAALAGQMLQAVALDDLINKRGTTWRKLSAQTQAELSTHTAVALMLAQPSVIRRPLLRCGQNWIAGHDEDKLTAFIRKNANH